MLAALDALIQNGRNGRGPVVLRQLCTLFLNVGVDGEASTTGLFDEVMANVAADLDDETVRFLAPELGQMASVLPAFAATMASRFHEIAARSVSLTLAEPALHTPTPETVAAAQPDEQLPAPLIIPEPEAPAATPRFIDRRAAPRLPEEDAENPITLARRASPSELLQIAALPNLPENITNVLISRGDREALQRALQNPTASFSKSSLTTLAELAPSDRMLKDALLARENLPEAIVERLLPFLALDTKARALMTGVPFGRDEARAALSLAENDLASSDRNGQDVISVEACLSCLDEGSMTASEVITVLARDIRVAELADFAARRLGIAHICAFNILSGRLDHAVAVLVRALDGDSSVMEGVMTMRRRCGCREAKESRSAFATGQRYSVEAAQDLIRRMDAIGFIQTPHDALAREIAAEPEKDHLLLQAA